MLTNVLENACLLALRLLIGMADMPYDTRGLMRRTKKRWIKPMLKSVPIFFECTCYAGAI